MDIGYFAKRAHFRMWLPMPIAVIFVLINISHQEKQIQQIHTPKN
jgi:hypothetical protein